jgi:hypothetical protein
MAAGRLTRPGMNRQQSDLAAYLFDGQPHPLAGVVAQWILASPRFAYFLETYRDKVRKKIRLARQPESALDLGFELEVAYRLLEDRRLELVYEPYASTKKRGPDYALTYRSNLVFNVEAARIRGGKDGSGERSLEWKEERIVHILLDKLGQMQAGMPNLLVIHPGPADSQLPELQQLMQSVKTRSEKKDPSFYSGSRYDSTTSFYRDFLHLSAILLWTPGGSAWTNRQARHPLPEKVLKRVEALVGGDAVG